MRKEEDQELSTLLSEGQNGCNQCYESFLFESSRIIRMFLKTRINNLDDIEDITQNILLSMHKGRYTYNPEKKISPWFYAICKNRLIDFYRLKNKDRANIVQIESYDNFTEKEDIQNDEIFEKIKKIIIKLPEPQNMILMMLKVDGLNVKEVSQKLKMSEGSIRVAASRGYKKIRELIEE